MSFAGAIADARKSATRMYINNFADKGRQNTIDILLVSCVSTHLGPHSGLIVVKGRLMEQIPVHLYDPINDYVTAELTKRPVLYP